VHRGSIHHGRRQQATVTITRARRKPADTTRTASSDKSAADKPADDKPVEEAAEAAAASPPHRREAAQACRHRDQARRQTRRHRPTPRNRRQAIDRRSYAKPTDGSASDARSRSPRCYSPRGAHADDIEVAKQHYAASKQHFDLGEWDEAIASADASPPSRSAYLFNRRRIV
jgi:hypothetical protein